MKVKVISRNPDDYQRETKHDIYKLPRNYSSTEHPFQEAREYVRAMNATKLERVFAKPFVASLDGHREAVHRIAKNPLRLSQVLTGSYDGEVRIWNLPTRHCDAVIQAHNGYIRGLCMDPMTGESAITVGDDSQMKQWRLPDPLPSDGDQLSVPSNSIALKWVAHDVTHSWTKPQFAICGEGVQLWQHGRNAPLRTFNWGVDTVQTLKYNPVESEILLAAASDRSLMLYDARMDEPLRKVVLKLRSNAVCWNPMEAFTFTAANEDYNLYTFDMRHLAHPRNVHMDHTAAVMDVDYAPTGREFVSGSYDRSVRIFPCEHGRSREVYHTKRMQRVISVMWSMDNKFLLSGSDEMNVRVWKANAAEKIAPMRPREKQAMQYAGRLKEKYGEHPEVRRIARHRHVPKSIYSATKEHRTIHASQKRKQANQRAHSSAGTVPFEAERQSHVVREEQ